MTEHPDIIQMNIARYQQILNMPLDDDTRVRVEQLLCEAKFQLGRATDVKCP